MPHTIAEVIAEVVVAVNAESEKNILWWAGITKIVQIHIVQMNKFSTERRQLFLER